MDRPGLQPFTVLDKRQLLKLQFTHTIGNTATVNAGETITRLQDLAVSGQIVRLVGFDTLLRGWFNIMDLSVQINQLTEGQRVDLAALTGKLQQTIPAPVKIGKTVPPLTRTQLQDIARAADLLYSQQGAPAPPGADYLHNPNTGQAPAPGFTPPSTSGRIYVVRAGDTQYSIATRQLGDGDRWKEIADLNRDVLKTQDPTYGLNAQEKKDYLNSAPGYSPVYRFRVGLFNIRPGTRLKMPCSAHHLGLQGSHLARTAAVRFDGRITGSRLSAGDGVEAEIGAIGQRGQ